MKSILGIFVALVFANGVQAKGLVNGAILDCGTWTADVHVLKKSKSDLVLVSDEGSESQTRFRVIKGANLIEGYAELRVRAQLRITTECRYKCDAEVVGVLSVIAPGERAKSLAISEQDPRDGVACKRALTAGKSNGKSNGKSK